MKFHMALTVVLGLVAASVTEAQAQQKPEELKKQLEQFKEELQRDGDQARLTLAQFTADLQGAERRVRMTLAKITAAMADETTSKKILSVSEDRLRLYQKLVVNGKAVITEKEMANLQLTRDKFVQEVIQKQAGVQLQLLELQADHLAYRRLVGVIQKLTAKD